MTGTERKALNKYYPPDFDYRKIPKGRCQRSSQYVIRVMAPFNMKCTTCDEYIYKGKKFNARRETVEDEDFLGLSLFRFYIRCTRCLAEITFKTDLENCDYTAEHGCIRLFDSDRLLRLAKKRMTKEQEEASQNAMTVLEERTKQSRKEMETMERLEELREMKSKQFQLNCNILLDELAESEENELEKQRLKEEADIRNILGTTGATYSRVDLNDDDDESQQFLLRAPPAASDSHDSSNPEPGTSSSTSNAASTSGYSNVSAQPRITSDEPPRKKEKLKQRSLVILPKKASSQTVSSLPSSSSNGQDRPKAAAAGPSTLGTTPDPAKASSAEPAPVSSGLASLGAYDTSDESN